MESVPRYTAGASGVGGTSKGSESTMWSYAVPSQNENATDFEHQDSEINGNGPHPDDDPQPLSQSSNQLRSSTRNAVRSKNSVESTTQQYNPQAEHGDGMDANGEAVDSQGLNGSSASSGNNRKRVASRERSRLRRKGSKGAVSVMGEVLNEDGSKWIHRDKLAQIESRELAQLGVRLGGKTSRTGSRRAKSTKTDKSVVDDDMVPDEITEEDMAALESEKLRQVAEDEVNRARDHNTSDEVDFFAQNVSQRNDSRPSTARSGTSRIPVPASSYPEDGDSPLDLAHKRSASFSRARRQRSQSQGSRDKLDSKQDNSPTSPNSKNNRVVSGNGKTRKPSVARKESGPDGNRSRANSTTDSPARPGTSNGRRPSTARPEGDPPWMANMYKPDPRLPPDQQMLPTHARRMAEMQQQAEDDATRRAVDRDEEPQDGEYTLVESDDASNEKRSTVVGPVHVEPASPVKNDTSQRESMQTARESYQQHRASYQQASETSEKTDSPQWPLRTPSGHLANPQDRAATASPTKPSKHDSNSTEHGGYNIMPTVQSPKAEPQQNGERQSYRSRNSQQLNQLTEKEREANAALAPVNEPVRLQDPEADKESPKEKKGCLRCCIVM